jgi:hypothetical protein
MHAYETGNVVASNARFTLSMRFDVVVRCCHKMKLENTNISTIRTRNPPLETHDTLPRVFFSELVYSFEACNKKLLMRIAFQARYHI